MFKKAVFLLVCVVLAGCGKNRVLQLSDRSDVYNRSLKWGALQAAGSVIAETNRRTLMERIARNVSESPIVEFSVLDLSVDPSDRKGSILVEFSYYGTLDQTLRYRQEIQSWQWDSAKRNWFLLDAKDLPVRKR